MLLLTLLACPTPSETAPPEAPPAADVRWPAEGAPLDPPETRFPDDFGKKRVYVEAGHGTGSNRGNIGVFCQREEDTTRETAEHLARALEATGHFEVRLARTGEERPDYAARIAAANAWADVLVSIHTDNRGDAGTWTFEGQECPRLDDHEGFTVLWSDEGAADLVAARKELARSLSDALRQTGFPAYDGAEYEGKYEDDPLHPGTMRDTHVPEERIMMLRRPTVPSVIIETHHTWHKDEVERWHEARTQRAFDAAVVHALVEALKD